MAKAAFNFAGQTFREKEKNYVDPAIEKIRKGADPVKTFKAAKTRLLADKKVAADNARAEKERKQEEKDKEITFDSIAAMLGMVSAENVAKYTDEQKSTLRDLLATWPCWSPNTTHPWEWTI